MKRKVFLLIGAGAVVVAVTLFFRRQPSAPQIGTNSLAATNVTPTPSLVSSQALEPAPVPPEHVPTERIAPLVQAGASYAERVELLKSLGSKLNTEESAALYDFLSEPGLVDGLIAPFSHGLKDAVMIALENQQPSLADWPEFLIGLYQDHTLHPVVRDYALQHLRTWYWRNAERGAHAERRDAVERVPPEAQREPARDVFWQALAETDSSIAGTALLALQELSSLDPAVEAEAVREAALRLAAGSRHGPLARITALQVCARMGVAEALPLAEHLTRESEHLPLRIAAIAALGQLGGAPEVAILENLAATSPQNLQPALGAALTSLRARLEL